MAVLLARLGRFSFRRRRTVTGVWVFVLLALGIGALTLSGQMSNTVTIPGTEAQRAIEHLDQKFPEAGVGGATVRVAIAAPEGEQLDKTAVSEVVDGLRDAPKVSNVVDPFQARSVSPDGQVAMAQVSYSVQAFEITESDREDLQAAADPGRDAGMQVEFGGDGMQANPETGATEGLGVVIAAIVLIVTFGSFLAAGLPLLTALIGIGVGMAGILTATSFLDLNSNTPILALMIGLAVGIDYALFIMSRYRTELRDGREPEDAVARSVGTAGSAVVFAGLTVIIALAGLTVVGIPLLGEMGIAASATVAIAVLIAVTLLPAVLGFVGPKKVLGGRIPGLRGGAKGMPAGEKWANFVSRHRVVVLVTSVAALLVVAIPALSMRLGLPTDNMQSPDSTQRKAYDLISSGFGPGMNGPLTVVIETGDNPQQSVQAVAQRVNSLDGVATLTPPQFNGSGDTAILNVIPTGGPDSETTENLVHAIRDAGPSLTEQTGAEVAVTGQTAMNIDISEKMGDALLPYLSLIVGLAFILMMLVFRSVIVPLKATLGFLGSVVAAFGAVVAVFQWGWLSDVLGVDATGPIMSMLPVLLIGVLFGLAMDYQVFLVTRMREEYVHGTGPTDAVIAGFRHGGRVVTAAALIMASVFAGFVFAGDSLIQSIGFALAFGVAVDAFVVRMTIVPAVMSLLGRAAWWLPKWLNRILPNVDVEGEQLSKQDDEKKDREPVNA